MHGGHIFKIEFFTLKTINKMRHSLIAILIIATVTLFACKKQTLEPTAEQHEKSMYRVLAIGKGDTTVSTTMFARTETVGLITAEDSRLRATLIAYTKLPDGRGQYTVEIENKQAGQITLLWGWQLFNIDQITPANNTLLANETKTYTLIGDAKEGKIKVQANGAPGVDNSSTLIVNITTAILPIKMIENVAKYDDVTKKTSISFTLEDPTLVDWILVQKQNEAHEWIQAALIASDYITKNWVIKL